MWYAMGRTWGANVRSYIRSGFRVEFVCYFSKIYQYLDTFWYTFGAQWHVALHRATQGANSLSSLKFLWTDILRQHGYLRDVCFFLRTHWEPDRITYRIALLLPTNTWSMRCVCNGIRTDIRMSGLLYICVANVIKYFDKTIQGHFFLDLYFLFDLLTFYEIISV